MDSWQKSQLAEERHQKSKRLIFGFDEFERFFQVDRKIFKEQSILAIGCGVTDPIHYVEAKYRVGIDPLYNVCAEMYKKEHTDNIPHIYGFGENLPFDDNKFDSVFIYGVLDHCIEPRKVMEETRRVLKIGGKVYIRVYTFIMPKVIRNKMNLVDIHPHHFSFRELMDLTPHGLLISSVDIKMVSLKEVVMRLNKSTIKSIVKYLGASILGTEDVALILRKCE